MDSVRAQVKISKAKAWLEDDYGNQDDTDSEGSFELNDVPYGDHRIVAKFEKSDGSTYKVRSEEIILDQMAPARGRCEKFDFGTKIYVLSRLKPA